MSAYPVDKIKQVVDAAYRDLSGHRENRIRLIEKYAGYRYLEKRGRRFEPFNFMQVAVSTYARSLYARNPRIMVNSGVPAMRGLANKFELALNHFIRMIDLKSQMAACVRNALFGMGIMKTGLMSVNAAPLDGPRLASFQPYAMAVDMDDFVYDTMASSWNDITFCGNRCRVPLAWGRNNPRFNEKARAALQPLHMNNMNIDGTPRAEEISKGNAQSQNMLEDFTEIWDIWLPKQGTVISIPAQNGGTGSDEPLMEVLWDGPRHGPFNILSYQDVPNNLQSVGPASHWESMHDVLNSLISKLNSQAKRSKHIMGVQMGGGRDAQNIQKTEDGGVISLSNPKNVQEIHIDGPDNPTMLYFLKLKELASWLAGNLESLAGLGVQAPTLGQEQLLANASNRTMQELSDRTVSFTHNVVSDIGEWMWDDASIHFPMSYSVPGVGMINSALAPEERLRGSFNDFNLDINVYSMQEDSPSLKVSQLKDFMGTFGPTTPILQQQGKAIDMGEMVRQWARYVNFPDVDKILVYADPNQQAQQGRPPVIGEEAPIAKWPKPPREEIRRTVGTRTESGSVNGAIFNSASKPKNAVGAE